MSEFIVITGLSGAGRSSAGDHLEDLGWFVIDNLPPQLIPKVAELAVAPGATFDRVVFVAGTGPEFEELVPVLRQIRAGNSTVRVLFLEASTDVLVRRYEGSRRRHPLGDDLSLAEAVEKERKQLESVKANADVVVDTSDLNVHQLRDRIVDLFAPSADGNALLRTAITSFGFKNGLPLDVDMVIDCRFLPNPYWESELRPLSGLDEPIIDYVMSQEATADFLDRLDALFELLLPAFVNEGKSYLTVAFGCTGGRHRSVVIAEAMAERLRKHHHHPMVTHRDIDR
ncbi:MAG: RNase adapter RapZ [Acidimicrobiia bacterium]